MLRQSIPKVSIRQIKAARALLAWSQEQLAAAAAISIPTVKRLEAQDGPLGGRKETESKILSALQGAGVEFIDENGGGPGVRMRKRSHRSESTSRSRDR
jgi:predicted transcriptional regulator